MRIVDDGVGRDSGREEAVGVGQAVDRLSLVECCAVDEVGGGRGQVKSGHPLRCICIDRGRVLFCIYIEVTVCVVRRVPIFKITRI